MTDLFTNHRRYADMADWHRSVDALRVGGPIQQVDESAMGFTPFWAVIGHEQVMAIKRQPELFANEPNAVLGRAADIKRQNESGGIIRSLVQMDAPDHPKYRKLTTDWFKPASLKRLQDRLDVLSQEVIDRMERHGGTCDFTRTSPSGIRSRSSLPSLGFPRVTTPAC